MLLSRRVVCIAFLALLLAAPLPSSAQALPEHVPGEVLIKFKNSAGPSERASIKASLNANRLRAFSRIGVEHWKVNGQSAENAIRRLQNNPHVE